MELFTNPIALTVIGTDDYVLYACHCKELKPVTKLYFCRHCTKLRCSKCVTHEVDSFYCPNCLENMPSTEAKIKKNRCANCFDCPSCGHSLSVRGMAITNQANPLDDQKANVKKMHYLNCGFCRWTTRDVGLPDQPTPSGGWVEPELLFSKKMSALLDYYKHMAHQDKMEKARQKITKRRTNMYLMDRYGYALSLGKKKSGSISSPVSPSLLSKSNHGGKEVQAPTVSSIVEEELEPIPDSYYDEPIILENILTLDQRLQNPAFQPVKTKDLFPTHKHLKVRRSQRCKECEHNLCKPEFNPSSIKFKIQLGGMQYCPIIQIVNTNVKFSKDAKVRVILSVTNPLDIAMNVTFMDLNEDDEFYQQRTSEIELPTDTITIAAKDATVEFDGLGSTSAEQFDDDPNVIHSRTSNKVSLYADVTPLKDAGKVSTVFMLTYDYKMVTAPLIRKLEESAGEKENPEEHTITLSFPVQINFGEITTTLC